MCKNKTSSYFFLLLAFPKNSSVTSTVEFRIEAKIFLHASKIYFDFRGFYYAKSIK